MMLTEKSLEKMNDVDERENIIHLLNICEKAGLDANVLEMWNLISQPLWQLGYRDSSFHCAQIALKSAIKERNHQNEAKALSEIAWILMERRNFPESRKYFLHALNNYEIEKMPLQISTTLRDIGTLWLQEHKGGPALRNYRKALKIITRYLENDNKLQRDEKILARQAEIYNLLGALLFNMNDDYTSGIYLLKALDGYRKLGKNYIYYQTAPLLNIGRWFDGRKKYSESMKFYKYCYDISLSINRKDTAAGALIRMAETAEKTGQYFNRDFYAIKAAQLSGTTFNSLRERAITLKSKGNRSVSLWIKMNQVINRIWEIFHFFVYAPYNCLLALKYYIQKKLRIQDKRLFMIEKELIETLIEDNI